jgi:hypothetical protein
MSSCDTLISVHSSGIPKNAIMSIDPMLIFHRNGKESILILHTLVFPLSPLTLDSSFRLLETLKTMRRESLRKQQFQTILELGVKLQDIRQEIKKLHNADPCPRETWLHLLNPLRTPLIASLTPQGNMMGLHCKTPESLRIHVRSERKKTDFLTEPAANTRARKDGPDSTPSHQPRSRCNSV